MITNKKSLLESILDKDTKEIVSSESANPYSKFFSISKDGVDSDFYISTSKNTFGKPIKENSGECYGINVNEEYKGLHFVFEVVNDMYENKHFDELLLESDFICEECFEIAIDKNLKSRSDILSERIKLTNDVKYHLDRGISLLENIYRPGSDGHIKLIKESREMWERGDLELVGEDKYIFEDTSLGTFAEYDGVMVPLDYPMINEEYVNLSEAKYKGRDVELNKPKRGGSKKFYVYVRKPNGGIKKLSFGDTTGLSVKLNDPGARKSFSARHDCPNKTDKTKASYWSCRLPRYANLLGLKTNFSGYW